MDLNPRQLFALNEMGIPVWALRTDTSPLLIEPADDDVTIDEQEQLLAKLADCHLIIVTETPVIDEQQKRLLHAIVFTLGISDNNLIYIEKKHLSFIGCSYNKPWLLFGEQLDSDFIIEKTKPNNKPVLQTFTLDELLNQAPLKVQVWQHLKSFKAKLAS